MFKNEPVIPAKTGIQVIRFILFRDFLDSRLRGNDGDSISLCKLQEQLDSYIIISTNWADRNVCLTLGSGYAGLCLKDQKPS